MSKTTCPVSKRTFLAKAPRTLRVQVLDEHGTVLGVATAMPQDFSSGAVGYYARVEGLTLDVDGLAVKMTAGMNIVAVGSKEAPAEDAPAMRRTAAPATAPTPPFDAKSAAAAIAHTKPPADDVDAKIAALEGRLDGKLNALLEAITAPKAAPAAKAKPAKPAANGAAQ